ncbi:MAG: threonine efflux protein [Candidatus Peregrinibacteria bacterium Greene0416_62]|nr:MAG: threonine efflux protein [Candidatus Peregrinibacteria bacterium Greene0416_62]TSC98999.1 MAG: threonine efflux protein [Candidatus Peregrinibacteria bacterium Greene1014_49]
MIFAKAYLFGLTLAFAVGPMALLIVQRGITKGLKSSLATALGIAVADFTYAIIAFSIGTSVLYFVEVYSVYVHLFSGVILLLLAIHICYLALRTYFHKQRIVAAKGSGNDFLSAYMLTMHNPMTVAIFLGFLGYLTEMKTFTGVIAFAFALFLGSLSGQIAIGLTASSLRGFFQNTKAFMALNLMSAVGIAVFAGASFLNALS